VAITSESEIFPGLGADRAREPYNMVIAVSDRVLSSAHLCCSAGLADSKAAKPSLGGSGRCDLGRVSDGSLIHSASVDASP
jgi:hypothetical protein